MKISFITTVFNEEKTIRQFLRSLNSQTQKPHEIIIVDGGSTDATFSIISNFKYPISNIQLKIFKKRGNRSVGRNEAIKRATGDIIVCSDSGNILDKRWVENITKSFLDSPTPVKQAGSSRPPLRGNDKGGGVDVVAGYYKGLGKNIFQKCLIPYVLVMPDKVDPENFLPATRSIAFTKKIWKKVGGFDEKFSHNEDYVFANKLKKARAKIVFAKDAVVQWIPRNSFKEAFIMFFRFALGDAEAGILRTNVLLLFARYFLVIYFIFLSLLYKSLAPILIIVFAFILYVIWVIKKNYKYVSKLEAHKVLPLLQFTADAAVLSGTVIGVIKIIKDFKYFHYVKQNKFLFFVSGIYVVFLLLTIHWGIPNQQHPFPYHMDEWHQLQAVGNTFRYGTPNTAGSANGTMFHFILSGFYLIPFTLVQYINPFSLEIENSLMRERIFEVLRLQTILFGVLSMFMLYKIAEVIHASKRLAIFLFTFTPIWLMLSGYFKYDIALLFWMLLSICCILQFAQNPRDRNFILVAIPASIAVAVKISAIPLFILYVVSYFFFHPERRKKIKLLFAGCGVFVGSLLFFGFPDTLFGKGNIVLYLFENIIQSPTTTSNFVVGMSPYMHLFVKQYPILFGHGMLLLSLVSSLFFIFIILREGIKKYKIALFLLLSLILFIISIFPLNIYGGGNRSLVLLPFLILLITSAFTCAMKIQKLKVITLWITILVLIFQGYISAVWMYIKISKTPQEISSVWIDNHIKKGSIIGLENVPIYQNVPDKLQKEFYFKEYDSRQKNDFNYQIIDGKSAPLPSLVVITNEEIDEKVTRQSPKKDLANRLEQEGYKKIASFSPDLTHLSPVGDEVDFYFSWLIASPNEITVYKK